VNRFLINLRSLKDSSN